MSNSSPVRNVIGPFPISAWRTLRMIREDVAWMKSLNQTGVYSDGIDKEKAIYAEVMSRYLHN